MEIGTDPPPPPTPPPPAPATVRLDFSFANGLDSWEPAYADYSLGMEASIGFAFGHERLPAPLDALSGLYLSADNRSDDLFMYIVRRLDGLAASRRYRVETQIRLATNVPPGCPGAGGSPGESIYVKAGATGVRPEKIVQGSYVRPNFDKGNQSTSGADAVVIGDLAQTTPAGGCLNAPYQTKTLSTGTAGPLVTTDASGQLWLIIGTDSGFEGFTKLYWLDGTAILTPA
ncbi:MAG: hypothetical protein KF780_06100 [Sphingomonas sp.]|nr:hypothetical protein [Sphingomonas sp.]